MNTTSNGTSTMRSTIFNYTRPSFTGFELADEPSADVARTIKELVKLLSDGFNDKNRGDDRELKILRRKLKILEDDSENGNDDRLAILEEAIAGVTGASVTLNDARGNAEAAAYEREKAKEALENLLSKQDVPAGEKPGTRAKGRKTKAATKATVKAEDPEIEKARELLAKKEEEKKYADEWKTQAENEKAERQESEKIARVALESNRQEVQNDVAETLRYIEAATQKASDNSIYSELLSLEYLVDHMDEDGKIKFKNKIGSNPQLNGLFILVEDQVQNNKLSYNAALFLRNPVIMEFIFLRAYLIDGLRDATAIFERLIDEQEGGIKYIYDFVVEKVVTKIIQAKKLKNGK